MQIPVKMLIAITMLAIGTISHAQTVPSIAKVTEDDLLRGNKHARISLVVYTDHECQACAQFNTVLKRVLRTYPDSVNQVSRPFPLPQHRLGRYAAIVGRCVATLKGKAAYWRYHDSISRVSTNRKLSEKTILSLAMQSYASKSTLTDCVTSPKTAMRIDMAVLDGMYAGIDATPVTFVLDTTSGDSSLVMGKVDFKELSTVIDEMLSSQK